MVTVIACCATLHASFACGILACYHKSHTVAALCCRCFVQRREVSLLKRTATDQVAVSDTLGVRTGCGCTT